MNLRLAILICTMPERYAKLRRLLDILEPQISEVSDNVFYKVDDAGSSCPTGTKRNRLIEQTSSDYIVFIDDDDKVTDDYVDEILNAMRSTPDVITYDGWITNNGVGAMDWTINLGGKYEEKGGIYYRYPNHIVPMKRELVRHVKFKDIWIQEDFIYATEIRDQGLLKTEVHIPKKLYHYDCWPKQRQSVIDRRGLRR